MIISNKHKFIYFFSIGNTATRSMQAFLSEYHDDADISIDLRRAPDVEKYISQHGALENYKKETQKIFLEREVTPRYLKTLFRNLGREEQFENYTKYATIRHPFQLIASIARSNHLGYGINWDIFVECLRMVEKQWRQHGHDPITVSRGQYNAYYEIGGDQMIDKFLKMEMLPKHIIKEFPFVNISKLPHFRHDYEIENRTYWEKEVGEGIIKVWKKDFEKFGYELSSDGGIK